MAYALPPLQAAAMSGIGGAAVNRRVAAIGPQTYPQVRSCPAISSGASGWRFHRRGGLVVLARAQPGGSDLVPGSRIASSTIVVGLVVFLLKGVAWRLTGSAALGSDALESVVNVAASAIALGAVLLAARPADANHPYGHDKVEFFAAVIEGVMIIAAAATILAAAWQVWRHPVALVAPWRGIGVNLVATGVNAAWAIVLRREGSRLRSPALLGDARHLMSDVVTSCGIAAGLTLAVLTGITRLDPILAALTAAHVLAQGVALMRSSVGGLMDELPDEATVEQVRALVGGSATGAIEAHDLRMRQAGRHTFVEFHLVVPGAMSVDEAHDICDRVEGALRAAMGSLVVTIHVEPARKAKHTGVVVL